MYYETIKRNGNLKGEDLIEYTHTSTTDLEIDKIFCYKNNRGSFFISILNLLTLGLIRLSYYFNLKFYIYIYFTRCSLKDPDCKYIVVISRDNNYHLLNLNKQNFFRTNFLLTDYHNKNVFINSNELPNHDYERDSLKKKHSKNKDDYEEKNNNNNPMWKINNKYSKINEISNTVSYTFCFRKNSYEYDDSLGKFKPIFFFIGDISNGEIHNKFGEGIKNLNDYNCALNRFGLNLIFHEKSSFLFFFFKQMIHPFYIYQFFSAVCWSFTEYYSYLILILIVMFLVILINAILSYKNWKMVFSDEEKISCKAIRNFQEQNNENLIYDSKIFFIILIKIQFNLLSE